MYVLKEIRISGPKHLKPTAIHVRSLTSHFLILEYDFHLPTVFHLSIINSIEENNIHRSEVMRYNTNTSPFFPVRQISDDLLLDIYPFPKMFLHPKCSQYPPYIFWWPFYSRPNLLQNLFLHPSHYKEKFPPKFSKRPFSLFLPKENFLSTQFLGKMFWSTGLVCILTVSREKVPVLHDLL